MHHWIIALDDGDFVNTNGGQDWKRCDAGEATCFASHDDSGCPEADRYIRRNGLDQHGAKAVNRAETLAKLLIQK